MSAIIAILLAWWSLSIVATAALCLAAGRRKPFKL